ncbi:MAG: pyruvate kinase [Clostridiaceae bacterium]|nr:pyruvate kinase [Clostridiaceae bacterium]
MRKTKIICTIGPATSDEKILREMILSGMNVARLNFSHGTHEDHLVLVNLIKKVRKELGVPVGILLDTKGPEIRTKLFKDNQAELITGEEVTILHEDVLGDSTKFSVTYKDIANDLKVGSTILIDDGLISLKVREIKGKDLVCTVTNGGVISNNKSINLPGVALNLPSLTAQDEADIKFAVENEIDFIAGSFIRKAADVLAIRRILKSENCETIDIIAKIENQEGVNNFENILQVSDGVMVARGDLGVEIPEYEVPTIQKQLIRSAFQSGKISITATEMLDSMIRNPRPTRAEVSDVANAVIDGTSAIMLSGETAMGKYPVESLRTMVKIASHTENKQDYWAAFKQMDFDVSKNVADAVSHACCSAAYELDAKAIVAISHSGRTARLVSRFRPSCPIVTLTVSESVCYRLALSWGVDPYKIDILTETDHLFEKAEQLCEREGYAENGDTLVISCGTPVGISGTTNTMKITTVGESLTKGIPIHSGHSVERISGDVFNYTEFSDGENRTISIEEGLSEFQKGNIFVAKSSDQSMLPYIRNSKAVIVEDQDPEGHAVTVCEALQIPLIYSAESATQLIKHGQNIVVDMVTGIIS